MTEKHDDIPKLAAGAAVNLFGKVAGRSSHVVTQVVLARWLGPEAFGLYALGMTVLRLAGVVSRLGLDKAVIHFGTRHGTDDREQTAGTVAQTFATAAAIAAVSAVALYAAADTIAVGIFDKPGLTAVLVWVALGGPLAGLLRVATSATRITQRMQPTVVTEDILQPLIALLLISVVLATGGGASAAMLATAVSFALALGAAGLFVARLFPAVSPSKIGSGPGVPRLLRFAAPASVGGLSTMLMLWLDRLLVGYFRPAADVGIYQAASQSATVFGIVLGAFATMFVPMIARLYHDGERERLQTVFRLSTKWPLYFCTPVLIVLIGRPAEFLTVVFGPGYEGAATALTILTLSQVVNLGTGSVGLLLTMTGHQVAWFRLSTAMLAVMALSAYTLIPLWGIVGAATSTAGALSTLFLLGLWVVRRKLGIGPHDAGYFKGIGAAGIAVGVMVVAGTFDWPSAHIELAVTGSAVAAAFFGSLTLLGVGEDDREFLSALWQRFSRRGAGS